jgi:hypothetical protein
MAYRVEATDEFTDWFGGLTEAEQVSVAAIVAVLEEYGPALKRPYVGKIEKSAIANLKELRIQHAGEPYRVLFAFDPRKVAILLLGGKKGPKRWYSEAIAAAERIFAEYLEELKKEGLL